MLDPKDQNEVRKILTSQIKRSNTYYNRDPVTYHKATTHLVRIAYTPLLTARIKHFVV